ncbi:MAG: FliH/SctL family protein [bacterium]
MRIIKSHNEDPKPAIQLVDFPVLEEVALNDGLDRDYADEISEPAGGAEESTAVAQAELERAQREGDQILEQAAHEADATRRDAADEAERVRQQAAEEAEQVRGQLRQEAEQAKKEAFSEGYSSGEESGYKEGYQKGYSKGKEAAAEESKNGILMLNRVTDELGAHKREVLAEAQDDIIRMAMAVAERILHKEIMTDPMAVVSVVKNAIGKVSFKKRFVINVNPLDIEVLQKASSEIAALLDSVESLKFRPDPKVEAGGCIIQTESGTVDAQVNRQFQEIRDQVLATIEEKKPVE